MKAHIPSKAEIERKLTKEEILRINKIWLFAIGQMVRISTERERKLYEYVYDIAGELYEDPENWLRIDDFVIDNLGLEGVFERENYDEREEVAKDLHKKNGKKWRQY